MTTDLHTIGAVAAELVAQGLPKYDHNPADRDWHGPASCWWVHHPEPRPRAPRTVIGIDGITGDHAWQFSIHSCHCCDAIVRTELVNIEGHSIGLLPFWPGLEAAVTLHRHVTRLWEAELDRMGADA
jgi:hypothetical protein